MRNALRTVLLAAFSGVLVWAFQNCGYHSYQATDRGSEKPMESEVFQGTLVRMYSEDVDAGTFVEDDFLHTDDGRRLKIFAHNEADKLSFMSVRQGSDIEVLGQVDSADGLHLDHFRAVREEKNTFKVTRAPDIYAGETVGSDKLLAIIVGLNVDPPASELDAVNKIFITGNPLFRDIPFPEYVKEVSGDRYNISEVKIMGPYKLPSACSGDKYSWAYRATQEAFSAVKNDVDIKQYGRIAFFITPGVCPVPVDAAGWGTYGKTPYMTSQGEIEASFSWFVFGRAGGIITHELGHNFGFRHASRIQCLDPTGKIVLPFSDNCQSIEYGNAYNPMGIAAYGMGQYSAVSKALAGWIPDENIKTAFSGQFVIRPSELEAAPGEIKLLRIPIDKAPSFYLKKDKVFLNVEYRRPIGRDVLYDVQSGTVLVTISREEYTGGDLYIPNHLIPVKPSAEQWGLFGGDVFTETVNKVNVIVNSLGADGANVTIDNVDLNGVEPAKVLTPKQDEEIRTYPISFTWTSGSGLVSTQLLLASSETLLKDAPDLYVGPADKSTAVSLPDFPSDGRRVFGRLVSTAPSGVKLSRDFQFFLKAGQQESVILAPQAGSTVPVVFDAEWTIGMDVTSYYISVSQTAAGLGSPAFGDLVSVDVGTRRNMRIGPLPPGPVILRVWSYIAGNWVFRDANYIVSVTMPTPTPIPTASPKPTVAGTPTPTPTPSVKVFSPEVNASGTFKIEIENGPGETMDWIVVSKEGSLNADFVDFRYLNGEKSPPDVGVHDIAFLVMAPATVGRYEVRLFAGNTYTTLAKSAVFEVIGEEEVVAATPTPPPIDKAPDPTPTPRREEKISAESPDDEDTEADQNARRIKGGGCGMVVSQNPGDPPGPSAPVAAMMLVPLLLALVRRSGITLLRPILSSGSLAVSLTLFAPVNSEACGCYIYSAARTNGFIVPHVPFDGTPSTASRFRGASTCGGCTSEVFDMASTHPDFCPASGQAGPLTFVSIYESGLDFSYPDSPTITFTINCDPNPGGRRNFKPGRVNSKTP